MPQDRTPPEKPRTRLWLWARLALTIATFWGLFHFVSVEALLQAAARIPASAMALCSVAVFVGQLIGVWRFQLLLTAYGATHALRFVESLRLFLVATFYNTFLPGAVAGDLVRVVAIRRCFADGGLTSSLTVGVIERITGFAGMLILTASFAALHPIPGIRGLLAFSLLGLLGAATAIAGIVVGRRVAHRLPGRLGRLAAGLPSIQGKGAFVLGLLCAVATHASTALGFHVLIRSLTPQASLAESMVIVPLACSAAYIPATVAGAGTRDAAFVLLYRGVGVSAADSLAMSLAAMLITLVIAALGGIATLTGPYTRMPSAE
ncbi:MAG: lysylphosphatidylglycerol synthase transmembrane domain-containing protein [Polyangiales bacterium]